MPTEADTCRTYIVPNLHTAGWDDEYITEQMVLTQSYLGNIQARLTSLRSDTGEELDALLPSVLDRAFKGEL